MHWSVPAACTLVFVTCIGAQAIVGVVRQLMRRDRTSSYEYAGLIALTLVYEWARSHRPGDATYSLHVAALALAAYCGIRALLALLQRLRWSVTQTNELALAVVLSTTFSAGRMALVDAGFIVGALMTAVAALVYFLGLRGVGDELVKSGSAP